MNRARYELRRVLKARGLTQTAAAAATGGDPGNLSRILRGERGPSVTLANAFQREFGILVSWWDEELHRERRPPRAKRRLTLVKGGGK